MPASADLPYGIAPPRYRLPADTHVGRVRLAVADLARSLAWYEPVLGVRVLGRDPGMAILGAHGDDTPLVELHERPGARAVPRRGRLGLYHFAILVPDRGDLGRLLAHLASAGEHPGMADHAVSEAIYLNDPDGLGIEVYADRPRDEWRSEGRQLHMTTDPLDVPGLLRAAGDGRWAGLPAGTTIGHVHLHVGDIAMASAFYHESLGLDKVVWSYPGALFLSAGGYHHHLGTNTWAAHVEPAGEMDARLLDWELIVPTTADAEQASESLAGAGHALERQDQGFVVADPWGTRVRVSA